MAEPPVPRLHVVTGKGGTGKTTVAAALALALAAGDTGGGRRVLLCEAEGRQGIAQLFDVPPLPYEERAVAVGPATAAGGGGEVRALAIDTEAALLEYLEMYYRLGRAGRVLDRFGVIDFVTTIAPGLRDVLLTGKVYEAHQRRLGGRRGADRPYAYDAIVLDAPPTGRIGRFLNVNHEVAGLAKVGPIRNQADSIMGVLHAPSTVVHLVTLLEDMPVQEMLDAVEQLQRISLAVGAVVVNQARTSPLDDDTRKALSEGRLARKDLTAGLRAAGLSGQGAGPGTVLGDGLLATGDAHVRRLGLEERLREEVEKAGRPVVTLPSVAGGIDLAALYELADELRRQGLA